MNVYQKINCIKKNFNNDIKISKFFGIKYGIIDFCNAIIFRSKGKIGKKINIMQHEMVKKYLVNTYGYLIYNFKFSSEKKIKDNSNIWVFWWQGIENAPDLVKKCIEHIKKYSGNHKVILICKDNFSNYTSIPNYILEKFEKNIISVTQFSDILRMELLYKNGGIWIDATMIPISTHYLENINEYSFYSIKHNQFSDFHVCKGKWSGFFIASSKGNCCIKLFRDFFLEYWKKENYLITYLLIDCIIALCYERNSYIMNEIEKVMPNNGRVFDLQPFLNQKFNDEYFNRIKEKTSIFKLSWKANYDVNSKDTFYGYIIKGKI